MPLPTCECISGKTPFERLDDIYCALASLDTGCTTPELVSASINEETVILVFNENVTGQNGFTMEVEGVPATLTYVSGEGTNTLVFESDVLAVEGDTVTLDYAPGDIANGECLLEAFVDFEVENNTGLDLTFLRPDGMSLFLRPDGTSIYLRA